MNSTRAVVIERLGPPEVLVEREVPLRDPGSGEVHLRIEAAGVNFADLIMRMGLYGTVPPRPYSPGFEVAGQIVGVGADVEGWREGDRAAALLRYGGYAHDAIVTTDQLFPYPPSFTPAEAAGIPVVFLTGWVCLFEAARSRAGETALILGAGGGVGTAAVQLALRNGLRVIGTAGSEAKRTFVTDQLGAEACFDSRGNWEPQVRGHLEGRGIDVALDPVGGKATAACQRLLAPLGRLVFYGMSAAVPQQKRNWPSAVYAWLRTPRFHPIKLVEPNMGLFGVHLLHLGEKTKSILEPALDEIYRAVDGKELRLVADRTFSLDREGAVQAHQYLHDRKNLGKVVLVRSQ